MLYLVTRTDKIWYDEYDSFVIRANNEDEAKQLAIKKGYGFEYSEDIVVSAISNSGKSEVILGSFNAG